MLRFFRQIRQSLLTDNPPDQASRAGKFSKYLLYAVGEILLVVIGILIGNPKHSEVSPGFLHSQNTFRIPTHHLNQPSICNPS